jgi:hypothetical protein
MRKQLRNNTSETPQTARICTCLSQVNLAQGLPRAHCVTFLTAESGFKPVGRI